MRWLQDLWLRIVMRPLGRALGTDRWEPHSVVRERCLKCGHKQVCVILTTSPCYDPETEAFWGTECLTCGEMACTSFGEPLDEPVEQKPT